MACNEWIRFGTRTGGVVRGGMQAVDGKRWSVGKRTIES